MKSKVKEGKMKVERTTKKEKIPKGTWAEAKAKDEKAGKAAAKALKEWNESTTKMREAKAKKVAAEVHAKAVKKAKLEKDAKAERKSKAAAKRQTLKSAELKIKKGRKSK